MNKSRSNYGLTREYCHDTSLRSKRFREVAKQRKTFLCFAREKNGARAKKGKGGKRERKDGNHANKPLDFETLVHQNPVRERGL